MKISQAFEGENSSLRKTFDEAVNTPAHEWHEEFDKKFLDDALDAFPEHPQTMLFLLTNIQTFIQNLLTTRDARIKELEEKVEDLKMEIMEMGEYD